MHDLEPANRDHMDSEEPELLGEGAHHEFSAKYRSEMAELFQSLAARKRRRSRIAKTLVVVLVAAALTVGRSEAFLQNLSWMFQTAFGQYVELGTKAQVKPENELLSQLPEDWTDFWVPKRTVEQFNFFEFVDGDIRKIIHFLNEDGQHIALEQWKTTFNVRSDNEGTEVYGLYVNGCEVYAFEKIDATEFFRVITWSDGTTTFRLEGNVSFNTLITFAQSLIYIN